MVDDNCIFCAVLNRSIPANIIEENEAVLAFHDINPAAPNHVLVIPKMHIESINDFTRENVGVIADMALLAKRVAERLKIDKSGYRFVINTGRDAGQSVFHLHAHVLGGRDFSWPPG